MTKPFQFHAIALAPRPWLTRETGECAFPVSGDGMRLMCCCNPCGRGPYCEPHEAARRGPPAPSAEEMERDIVRWLERPR